MILKPEVACEIRLTDFICTTHSQHELPLEMPFQMNSETRSDDNEASPGPTLSNPTHAQSPLKRLKTGDPDL
jgi:hypothetical protein